LDEAFYRPLQSLVNQARSSKVTVKKMLRRVEELVNNTSALGNDHAQGLETLAYNSSAIASATAKVSLH
jgi:dynactin 1